jgi:hypothetical protein
VEVTFRLWHVLVVVVGVAMMLAFMAGRYVMPIRKTETKTVYIHVRPVVDEGAQHRATAQADLRAVVPGMEAYNADHASGYTGVTMTNLQESYDAGINEDGNATIVKADTAGYCIQSTVGSATYHKEGPAGDIVAGPCP